MEDGGIRREDGDKEGKIVELEGKMKLVEKLEW